MIKPKEPTTHDQAVIYALWEQQKRTNELLEQLLEVLQPKGAKTSGKKL